MFGDKESIVNSSTNIHAKLHKRYTALSFDRLQTPISSRYVRFNHIPGTENQSDVSSKHWSYNSVKDVVLPIFN